MAKADKILSQMISNPRGKWRIEDIETVCRTYGLTVLKPKSGSHYKVAHSSQHEILTVPAHRPIKPVYIRKFVAMVRRVESEA
jgi:hypothetical protein